MTDERTLKEILAELLEGPGETCGQCGHGKSVHSYVVPAGECRHPIPAATGWQCCTCEQFVVMEVSR